MPMKRIVVVVLLAILTIAMAASPCWACSCVPSTKKEKAAAANVTFTGKVKKIMQPDEAPELKVRFRVGRVYKGHPKRITRVFTATSGAMCGVHFEKGKRYTVFAKWNDSKKWTNSCSGTKRGPINPDDYGLPKGYAPKDG